MNIKCTTLIFKIDIILKKDCSYFTSKETEAERLGYLPKVVQMVGLSFKSRLFSPCYTCSLLKMVLEPGQRGSVGWVSHIPVFRFQSPSGALMEGNLWMFLSPSSPLSLFPSLSLPLPFPKHVFRWGLKKKKRYWRAYWVGLTKENISEKEMAFSKALNNELMLPLCNLRKCVVLQRHESSFIVVQSLQKLLRYEIYFNC